MEQLASSYVDVFTVAVDPGKRHAGVAVFLNDRLIAARVFTVASEANREGPYYKQGRLSRDECSAGVRVAWDVAAWLADVYKTPATRPRVEYVGEIPQVRPPKGKKKKNVNPEDLMFVQTTNAAIAMASGSQRIRYCYPEEHKGQIDPEIYWDRVLGKLRPEEKAVVDVLLGGKPVCDATGHGVDAIGVGLWSLFR